MIEKLKEWISPASKWRSAAKTVASWLLAITLMHWDLSPAVASTPTSNSEISDQEVNDFVIQINNIAWSKMSYDEKEEAVNWQLARISSWKFFASRGDFFISIREALLRNNYYWWMIDIQRKIIYPVYPVTKKEELNSEKYWLQSFGIPSFSFTRYLIKSPSWKPTDDVLALAMTSCWISTWKAYLILDVTAAIEWGKSDAQHSQTLIRHWLEPISLQKKAKSTTGHEAFHYYLCTQRPKWHKNSELPQNVLRTTKWEVVWPASLWEEFVANWIGIAINPQQASSSTLIQVFVGWLTVQTTSLEDYRSYNLIKKKEATKYDYIWEFGLEQLRQIWKGKGMNLDREIWKIIIANKWTATSEQIMEHVFQTLGPEGVEEFARRYIAETRRGLVEIHRIAAQP